MNAPTQLATLQQQGLAPREAAMHPVRTGFFDLQSFELMQRVAKGFASSTLVPQQYQGNVANCMIALNMAQRIGADPMMVMQSLVIVHGRPTWAAQFLIATANACGRFSALRFEFFGQKGTDEWGCRAYAIEKDTGERLDGSDVTIAIAKKEGWYNKNGSKWQSIPQQMLMYRAGSWWVRAYAPELSMGLTTAEEAVDIIDITRGEDGTYSADLESLRGAPAQQTAAPAAAPAQDAPGAQAELATTPAQAAQPQGDGYMSAEESAAIKAAEMAEAAGDQPAQTRPRRERAAATGSME